MKNLKFYLSLSLLICLSSVSKAQHPADPSAKASAMSSQTNVYKNAKITSELFSTKDNKWGYNLLVDGKLFITQPTIPAVSGNNGFQSKKDAATIAELMMEKIKNGQMPPTITVEELKTLHIIK